MQPTFLRLPETDRLYQRARELAVGDAIATAAIAEITGRTGEAIRGICASVCKMLERDGIQCRFTKARGLYRMADDEVCDRASVGVRSVARKSKREIHRLAHVAFAELTPDKQREHLIVSSQLGALAIVGGQRAAKVIAGKIVDKPLELGATLALFGNGAIEG